MTHEPPASVERADRLREALERQMEKQDETLPSSVARDRGLIWLEGWFDLASLLTPPARSGREEIARLEAALRLARNRLQAHAIDSIARGDKHSFEHGEWADHATAALSARIKRGDCPFVAGPVWQDDECWTSEVQVVGGHAVVLTVHGASKAEVITRRDACLLALFDGASA